MMTMAEFLADRPALHAEVARIPMRPGTDPAEGDAWMRGARHWVVEIRRVARPGKPTERMAVFYSQGSGIKTAPTLADVLDSLATDASLAAMAFGDYAAEIGGDADSRALEATYRACVAEAADLRRVLGAEDYRTLLEEVERL